MIKNKFIRNYYPLLIIVIGFVFILILGFFVFKFAVERERMGEQTTKASTNIAEVCKDYPKSVNEISCFEAVNIATSTYPSNALSVRRISLAGNETLWNVELALRAPINLEKFIIQDRANVVINANTSKITSVRQVSG